jgi:phage major head subunit gpT-like protein
MYLPIGQAEANAFLNEVKSALKPCVYQMRRASEFRAHVDNMVGTLLSKTLAAIPLREKVAFTVEDLAYAITSDDLKSAIRNAICQACAINIGALTESDRSLLSRSRLHLTHFFV